MADQYYRLESEHGPLDALLLLKDTGQVDAGGHPIVKVSADAGQDSLLTFLQNSSKPFTIPITLTVTNGTYTIGDVVGGLITIPNAVSGVGKHGLLTNVELAGVAALEYNLFFFDHDIATPAADNAVGTMVAADIAMCKGIIPIDAAHYKAPVSSFNVATLTPNNSTLPFGPYACLTNASLCAYMIARAVTSPGTTTLTATFKGFWLD